MQRTQGLIEVAVPDGTFESLDGLRSWITALIAQAVTGDGGTLVYFHLTSASQDAPVPVQPPDGF